MLRMQLPVLLSFAFLRCFMGYCVKYFTHRFLPTRLYSSWKWITVSTSKVCTIFNCMLFCASILYSIYFIDQWKKDADRERPRKDLICSEFACTRVQGLMCGIGLITMTSNRDPFVLSLALATLKAVADGTVYVLVISVLTIGACNKFHHLVPRIFFSLLYGLSLHYSMSCYSDDDQDNRGRIGASVISMCFASLFLSYCMIKHILSRSRLAIVSIAVKVKRILKRD